MTLSAELCPAEARRVFASEQGVREGVCPVCEAYRLPVEFVHVVVRRGVGRSCVARPHCTACVAAGRAGSSPRSVRRRAHGLTRDLLEDAERVLYPGVRYHRLSADQRRHCYIVARTWWLHAGLWKFCRVFDQVAAWNDVNAMVLTLARRGLPVIIPPSPIHADLHIDD